MTESNSSQGALDFALDIMLHDMRTKFLGVGLAPSVIPEVAASGGYRRVVESQNAKWYRDLCAGYDAQRRNPRKRRKHDTLIKRRHVVRALERIQAGARSGEYIERVMPYVLAVAAGDYDESFFEY